MTTKQNKTKVEVFLTGKVRERFEALCTDKGISLADGLRRAIEIWMEKSHALR